MQALCLNVRVMNENGEEIEIRELDEDAFRTTESLGIDLSRPERGTDEEDAARAHARGSEQIGSTRVRRQREPPAHHQPRDRG